MRVGHSTQLLRHRQLRFHNCVECPTRIDEAVSVAGGTFDTIAEAQAAPLPQSFGGFSFEQVLTQGCGGFSWSVFDMKKDQSETTEDAFPTHQMCLVKTRLEIP